MFFRDDSESLLCDVVMTCAVGHVGDGRCWCCLALPLEWWSNVFWWLWKCDFYPQTCNGGVKVLVSEKWEIKDLGYYLRDKWSMNLAFFLAKVEKQNEGRQIKHNTNQGYPSLISMSQKTIIFWYWNHCNIFNFYAAEWTSLYQLPLL